MFNKKYKHTKGTITFEAWKKLKKNKPAMVGFYIIILAILVSFLGGNIRPDSSVNANHQVQSIARLNPGSKIMHLKIRKNQQIEKVGFFGQLFFGGQPNKFKYVPFYSFQFKGDKIEVEEFTGSKQSEKYLPLYRSYPLADIVLSLSIEKDTNFITNDNGTISCWLHDDTEQIWSIEELKKEAENNNIVDITYYLGTDKHGRDMLSRLMAGTIVSLSVGLIAVIISVVIGLFLGSLAGFYRGRVDDIITWFINMVWSIPGLLLVISLTLIIGKGFTTIFFAVGLTMWVELARMVRGQIMSIREKDYIEAGRALGYNNGRLIWRHILPNIMGPVIVICASNFAAAILIEAGLSFLGIGVQIPMPSWGFMIDQHKGLIMDVDKSYLALLPGLFIIILVFAFMMLGNGLRDALDIKGSDDSFDDSKLKGAPTDHI